MKRVLSIFCATVVIGVGLMSSYSVNALPPKGSMPIEPRDPYAWRAETMRNLTVGPIHGGNPPIIQFGVVFGATEQQCINNANAAASSGWTITQPCAPNLATM